MARLDGTTQDDQLIWEQPEPVEIYGFAGNDSLRGGQGNDAIYGNTGQDSLGGDTGNDTLYGGKDNDSIFAVNGTDQLFGGKGDDYLFVASRNGDTDTLTGGEGNDTFNLTNDGPSIITDFNSSSDFLQLVANNLPTFVFRTITTTGSNSLVVEGSNNGGLSFDTTLAILTNYTGGGASIFGRTTIVNGGTR